ncbi:3-deoxy-7-phosphoheptulonate synthase [Nanoarchaeota archaeon]
MIIRFKKGINGETLEEIVKKAKAVNLEAEVIDKGTESIRLVGIKGDTSKIDTNYFLINNIEEVVRITKSYKLVSREYNQKDRIIEINNVKIGGDNSIYMAGPCSVEDNEELMLDIARKVKEKGAQIFRAGSYKPRTNAFSYQGMRKQGLPILKKIKDETGLLIVTEVMDTRRVELVAEYSDIIQVGTRNMQNFELLKEVGKQNKPVLLKRGMSASLSEFLNAAQYIVKEGNKNVMLCLRGVRPTEDGMRNMPDLGAINYLKKESNLPVIFDPSHAAGKRSLVDPHSRQAIAGGADGLIIEVHTDPDNAASDGHQTITPDSFGKIVQYGNKYIETFGRY